ncbi:MAG: isoprenyl transferase [Planctomycetaceae bacterium]|nr:Ditrans,polycis-undecaprenyl-diphosphate synthase ((2E,6E)-farnesyl-diphosphate specific) [Planctomycetota bacterium]MCQ3949261.1 di-trans,poly-cis-decaprenylcistransferase [Planctomycetota bacterium]NUO16435.1 isoprenyl transferase [Planctomycetaceae bacterium]GIK52663.1 MAG: isoprenyl transferase [Planctomycetota bacterium]
MPTVPRHIAIIMDGNGRWAQSRGMMRIRGHEAGVDSVRAITEECARLKVGQLTVYAFSAENWKRPRLEIELLMQLLKRFLVAERDTLMNNDVRLTAIGRLDALPKYVLREYELTRKLTENNKGTNLCLALNYGGRNEIVDAMQALAREVAQGRLKPEQLDEALIQARLYQPNMPEPDLVIRTGGEMRISNFLLWQISYSELYVTETLWPDFRAEHLHAAITNFNARERRFGGLVDRLKPANAG